MVRFGLLVVFVCFALVACEGGKPKNRDGNALETTYPYIQDSPYAGVLKRCIQATSEDASCTLATLPPIAMTSAVPTVDDIMDRVLVSHEWMGSNFRELLEVLPEDLHSMFGAVTAVVIGAEIRPSYYWHMTGAIYLDAGNVWLTYAQRDMVTTKHDYRQAFADPMSFRSVWRRTQNGLPYEYQQSTHVVNGRALNDLVVPMASLLYHELAHANDIMSPYNYDKIDLSRSIYSSGNSLYQDFPSTDLAAQYPLESPLMMRMAAILYRGEAPDANDIAVTAAEVGSNFAEDRANDDYAYTTQYEDLAMLIEEFMLKIHFNVDRDTAFTSAPLENGICEQYVVQWGVRNRIGEARVIERLQFVLEKLFPERDFSADLAALPAPTALPTDKHWCNYYLPDEEVPMGKPGSQGFGQTGVPYENTVRPYRVFKF